MSHRYPWLILLSVVVVASCAVGIWSEFTPAFNAPFAVTLTDAHTVSVQPLRGVAFLRDSKPATGWIWRPWILVRVI